jgi:hypothetical protein
MRGFNKLMVSAGLLVLAQSAQASFMQGETLDTFADVLAWVILIFMPIGGLYLFWMVHIMPEKIAHKRHHPQKDAIHTLCLLSLAFGGLLWPIAWLWAYTKPVFYKMAYGTDRVSDDPDGHVNQDDAQLAPLDTKDSRDDNGLALLRAELEQLKSALAAAHKEGA